MPVQLVAAAWPECSLPAHCGPGAITPRTAKVLPTEARNARCPCDLLHRALSNALWSASAPSSPASAESTFGRVPANWSSALGARGYMPLRRQPPNAARTDLVWSDSASGCRRHSPTFVTGGLHMRRLCVSLLQTVLASSLTIPVAAVAEPPGSAAPTSVTVSQHGTAARDAASGLPAGKRMHKPYTLTAPAAVNAGNGSGGQQTDTTMSPSAPCRALAPVADKLASDPEEGGQVARTAPKKPAVSDMTATRRTDSASTRLMEDSAQARSCP